VLSRHFFGGTTRDTFYCWVDQVVIGPLMRICWDKATLGQGRVVIGATAVLGRSSGDRCTDAFLLGQG
jgi:hypothetical protein